MSGFFVSNNLGTFSAEGKTPKVFKADILGWGGATSTGTFKDVLLGNAPAAPGKGFTHKYKKVNSSSSYTGMPSWSDWTGDSMELSGGGDYGFHIEGANDSSAWFQIEVPAGCELSGTGHIGPTANYGGDTVSILTAADRSDFPSVRRVGTSKNKVEVELTNSGHYISLDPAAEVAGIATFTIVVPDKDGYKIKFQRSNDNADKLSRNNACSGTGGTWGTPFHLSLIKWEKLVHGCGGDNTTATNYNSLVTRNDDSSCTYTPATISTFTISNNSVLEGANETVTFDWTLDSSNRKGVSTVKLYANNTDGSKQEIASWGPNVFSQALPYNTSSLPIGTTEFKLVAAWDKNAGNPDDAKVSLTVNSPQTLVSCNDPNASKYGETSETGDCGACNSNYYLGTDGLCTTCADPNMNTDSNGRCTTCLSGYTLHTDGTCQKVGCMTYADGASASDDYNYDPDAVVNDSTMCQGAAGTGTGNGGTPDVDCELSDWADWSEFSGWSDAATASGTRTRTRSRTIVTDSGGNGATCGGLEETETETGELDPDTGEVTTITTSTGDTTPVTPTTTPSPVIPIILGVAGIGLLALLMRR